MDIPCGRDVKSGVKVALIHTTLNIGKGLVMDNPIITYMERFGEPHPPVMPERDPDETYQERRDAVFERIIQQMAEKPPDGGDTE